MQQGTVDTGSGVIGSGWAPNMYMFEKERCLKVSFFFIFAVHSLALLFLGPCMHPSPHALLSTLSVHTREKKALKRKGSVRSYSS